MSVIADPAPAPAAATPDGLPKPRRYWAAAVIILAIVMSVLDSTIVNIALPSIARDFDASAAASIWVVNAYQLAILMLLLPLASLGEIVGYRRVSQAGLLIFTVASVGCALAPSLATLSIARAIQGVGAAGIMSVNAALLRFTYPHRSLGRALGINALAVASAAAIGPTIASAILAVAHWRWLFGINVPIGLVTFTIALRALPHSERSARRLNWVGAVLYAGAFGAALSGLQSLAHEAATPIALMQLGLGVILGWLLVLHEQPRQAPLVPFDLLRVRLFRLSLLTSVCSFMAQMTALVALPFEIQRLGHTAVATGLLMTPWPLALACAAPIAGRLADRHPAGILGGAGLLVMSLGLVLLAFFPASGTSADFIWRMALCGLGFGFFQSPNNRTIMAAAPRARSGAAGGLLSAARLAGQTLGAASVAILFRAYAAAGSNLALCLAAALALAAAVVSLVRLKSAPTEGRP
ncbi:MAG TPA: MFS transporter [Steroidobacteraceae bacterium]|jgi:DHA2 family multidrug resistance protein-like MFS transporter|nr:MFS transporter [Steroidobacteraceae bacterium]